MPCFSASNIRFISAQQQQQLSVQERAKTAPRTSYQLPKSSSLQHRFCAERRRESMHEVHPQNRECLASLTKAKTKSKAGRTQLRQALKSQSVTLKCKELERLQGAAKVISVEERLEALAKREQLSQQLEEQAERSRLYFRKIDEERLEAASKIANKEQEEDLFDEADKKKTLERAFMAKHEQEEEVKAVNRIILNAKCHAVRDAQVQEKHDIERDQKNEETRLEKLVLEEAMKALSQDDCTAEQQKIRNAKHADAIREQLVQRQYLRFLEAERAEEEAKMLREAAAALKRDEEHQAREARARRHKFREELNRVIEVSNLFKKMLCEQEHEADMRVAAYMREKREREKELEREKRLAKEEFERQQQHLYQLAQKIADSRAHRDELCYLREQERAERDYRRREKEIALRKKQLELDIKETRERQMQETKARHALQIAREEKDFNILIDNLRKEEARLKKQEEERQKQRKSYRAEIIRQISDKALAKRRLLEEERTEANLWRQAENQRLANIRAVISAKLAAMREACLPERYIRDVERQLNRFLKTNAKTPVEDKA